MSNLSEELKYWRCERPSEYKMDDFIRSVERLEKENAELRGEVEELKEPFFIIWLNEIDKDIIEPTFVRNMCCIKIKSIIGEELFLDGIEEFLECHGITLSDEGIELEVSVAITEKGQPEYNFEYNGG